MRPSRAVSSWPAVLAGGMLLTFAAGAWAQGADGPDGAGRMSLLQLLLKGRWFMVPIGLCSLLGVAIIIERLVALRRSVVMPSGFLDELKSAYDQGGRSEGMELCGNRQVPIARIALAGLRKLPRGPEAVEGAVEDAGAHEISKLRRNLRLLYGVGAVAPMLGLLGTVWGMITAFQVASVQGLGKAEHLATGIYEALVTTFAGLLVAIPTVIFYYYFLSKIDALVHDMNELSIEFVEHTTDPDQGQPPVQAAE